MAGKVTWVQHLVSFRSAVDDDARKPGSASSGKCAVAKSSFGISGYLPTAKGF